MPQPPRRENETRYIVCWSLPAGEDHGQPWWDLISLKFRMRFVNDRRVEMKLKFKTDAKGDLDAAITPIRVGAAQIFETNVNLSGYADGEIGEITLETHPKRIGHTELSGWIVELCVILNLPAPTYFHIEHMYDVRITDAKGARWVFEGWWSAEQAKKRIART